MWKRIAGAILLAATVASPVLLTEQALRMPPERRPEPDRSKAQDIANATGTAWSEAEITAPDGAKLRGWAFLPPAERDSGKAILLLHGAGDSRKGMLGFTRFFAQRGYATLAVDSRGHGISGGPMVTYGLLERGDGLPAFFSRPVVGAAFDYAQMRYGFDLEAISPLESLKRAHTPVLLIHGLADGRTAPEQSRELYAVNPKVAELWEVPGAKHVQAPVVAEQEFEKRVLRGFDK